MYRQIMSRQLINNIHYTEGTSDDIESVTEKTLHVYFIVEYLSFNYQIIFRKK